MYLVLYVMFLSTYDELIFKFMIVKLIAIGVFFNKQI